MWLKNRAGLIVWVGCISIPAFPAYAAKCADFKTQQQAQNYFIKHGDKRLDRDKDGRGCDCLPGGNGQNCPGKSRRK